MQHTHSPRQPGALTACAAAVAALLWAAPAAWAQDAKAEQDAKDKKELKELPQITVTATRVNTSLLKTPVAVSALKGDDLVKENVKGLLDLSGAVPNIQFGLSDADSGVKISIRGVTSSNFTEIGDPAVGVHLDGIYSPRPQGALALMFDLDQVEVLRGAQGTLFGRNSTAGVVNILPAKPDFKSNYGWTSLQFGNYNAKQVRSVYNLSVADNFALRAAVMVDKRDGYINQVQDLTDRGIKKPDGTFSPDGKPDVDQRLNKAVSPADYYSNSNQWAARLTARWAINKDLEWTGGYEHFKNGGAGDVGMKDCEMSAGTRFACGPEGQWYAKINVPGKIDMTIDTWRSKLVWNLNKDTELTYRLSYAQQQRYQQHDDDVGQIWLAEDVGQMQPWGNWGNQHVIDKASYTLNSDYRTWVNELQLTQRFSKWRYVAGLFNMSERNSIDFAQDNLVSAPWAMPQGQFYDQPDRRVDASAIFAQADIALTDKLTSTVGFRYSKDKRTDNQGISSGGASWSADTPWYYNGKYTPPCEPGLCTPHNGTDLTKGMGPFMGKDVYPELTENTYAKSWKKPTYRFGLQYDFDKTSMVFGSLSTGYRAGGFGDKFDTCGGGTCTDGSTRKYSFLDYKPETTTNFELGHKGRYFNNKLELGAVYFNTKYRDMHVTGMNAVGVRKLRDGETCPDWDPACEVVKAWKTENIGNSTIQGLELEFKALPWQGGTFSGYAAITKSRVDSYPTYNDEWICGYRAEFGAPPCAPLYLGADNDKRGRNILDVRGNQLPYTPKYSFALNYGHDFSLGNGMVLSPWIGMRWQSKMYFSLRNLDNPVIGDFQKAYTNWNAALKLAAADGKWDVELWGNNLSNNIVKNWMGQGSAGGYTFNSYNPPRMFGVRATVNY